MTADELLDAHELRLRNDPGYRAIWGKSTGHPVIQERILVAMLTWAEQADGLRRMVGVQQEALCGRQFLVECPHCKARIGISLSAQDGGPHV